MTNMQTSPWHHARENPEKLAIAIADTGESLTYGQMMSAANRLANLFVSLGLEQGDTVAFFLENTARYLCCCWAAKSAGLYYVCIGRQLNAADVAYILENSGAKVLITSLAQGETAVAACKDIDPAIALLMMDGTCGQFRSYEDAVRDQPETMLEGRRRGASMLYSSGTTGRPKGIRHDLVDVSPHVPPPRHAYLTEEYGFGPETVLLNPGPFYHTAPLRFMMHVQRAGGTVVGFARFDAEAVLRAIERYRATNGFFVATMFVRFLALPQSIRNSVDVSSMRYALHGAAPISIQTKERMIDWWGPVICEMYGGTESNGTTTITAGEWLAHKGSVGRPSKGTEIHIVDENGEELPPNVRGLVYMTNGKTFEYLGEPEKTRESRHPKGWSTLGDIGYVDDDGYLYLTDRQSNLIISGGVNIYPQEAENVLVDHPEVADVAVIGVPNADFGEEVKAVVVAHRSLDAEARLRLEADLIAYCRSRISTVKCPRSVDFVDALPRSEAGKVLKKEVRKRYWPEGTGPGA